MKKTYTIVATFILSLGSQAQNDVTVNTGDLSVSPGTEVSTYFDFHNRESGRVLNDGHFYFYDDYNNDGIFAHTVDSSTGYVIFEGKSGLVQNISGSAPSDFANVLFNKEGGDYSFNLTNEISITNPMLPNKANKH